MADGSASGACFRAEQTIANLDEAAGSASSDVLSTY